MRTGIDAHILPATHRRRAIRAALARLGRSGCARTAAAGQTRFAIGFADAAVAVLPERSNERE